MPSLPIRIETIDDPRVAVFRDVRDADLRGRDGLFMAESEAVLRRLFRQSERLHSILVSPHKYERMRAAIEALPAAVPVYVAELELMCRIAGFLIHRGALAAGSRPVAEELTLDAALGRLSAAPRCHLLLAEGLTNVDNMGALFRNAAAFGADGIVLDPNCCDPLYRKAIRVSMGHALAVPYAQSTNWRCDLKRLKNEWGIMLVGAELTPGARPLWQLADFCAAPGRSMDRIGVIFGSEAHGLAADTLRECDVVVQIPMCSVGDETPSLNVAVASAVMLYELNRGR